MDIYHYSHQTVIDYDDIYRNDANDGNNQEIMEIIVVIVAVICVRNIFLEQKLVFPTRA